MSGFFSPAAAKMSITSSDETARDTICRIAWSMSSGSRLPLGDRLGQNRLDRLEERRLRPESAIASSCGHRQGERFR